MSGFHGTFDASFRRYVRAKVKSGPFTPSDKNIILAIVNLWFHHKSFIHPGRKKLAAKAGVTEKTVSRSLAKLRQSGVLILVSHLTGGRKATRYDVDAIKLLELCGCPIRSVQNVPLDPGQMSHGTTYREKGPVQGFGLRVVGGRES